jgi:hypothetical protein
MFATRSFCHDELCLGEAESTKFKEDLSGVQRSLRARERLILSILGHVQVTLKVSVAYN